MSSWPPSASVSLHDLPHAVVDRLHRLDPRLDHAGVADHVGVGEIQDHQVVFWQRRDAPSR